MIIFDTNAVNLLPPSGPRADIIRKLRQSGHHRVAVPWVVMEELVAHQTKHYPAKYQTAVNTLAKLRDVLPWKLESSLEALDLERFVNHWRNVYEEIFEVIDTSGEAARMALSREAMALPPAKRANDHSEGARDVAVWFSLMEYLKNNPDEDICFVTNNTKDFGDGTAYPYPMNEDLRGLEDRLTRLTDFDDVISTFTKEVSGQEAEAAAEELLRSLAVRECVARTAVEVLSSPVGFTGLDVSQSSVRWHRWLHSPATELLSLADVTGHEIGDSTWYTANTRWLLYGPASGPGRGGESMLRHVSCVWEMRVLFSASGEQEPPTLLAPGEPSLPDTADTTCMEVLRGLKAQSARVARQVLRNRPHRSPAEEMITQSVAQAMPTLDIAGILPHFAVAEAMGQNAAARLVGLMPALDAAAALNQDSLANLAAGLDLSGVLPHLEIGSLLPTVDFSHLFPSTSLGDLVAGSVATGLTSPSEDSTEKALPQADDSRTDPQTPDDDGRPGGEEV